VLARLRAWWLARRARGPALTLVLYTKRDCPLCDELRRELARAGLRPPWRLAEVDVERDPELRARYGLSVPVLELEGRTLAKGRASAAELARRYARLVGEIRAGRLPRGAERRESRHG